jgi:hypothetical protein
MTDVAELEEKTPDGSEDGVALALSGGGYRAMVYENIERFGRLDHRRLSRPDVEQAAICKRQGREVRLVRGRHAYHGGHERGRRSNHWRSFEFYKEDQIKSLIDSAQPDVLAAQATAADNTLNNQSLVILFSFDGKNLLFAGDAQWGNWEHFLYGGAYGTTGHTAMTDSEKSILNKIDFYKVGHHGSANATPKDAVSAMRLGCVGMCSTQIKAYNQVPREPLLDALRARMNGQLARSDQVAARATEPANPAAGILLNLFKKPTGQLFIDYEF